MIALDADALGLAIKGVFHAERRSRSNRELEDKRAKHGKAFIADLAAKKEPVMVSTVTVAEYLQLFDDGDQADELAALHRVVRVYPFDERAAVRAARLRRKLLGESGLRKLYQGERVALKADILVVATAINAGAQTLISYDVRLAGMVKTHLAAELAVQGFPAPQEMDFGDVELPSSEEE